MRRLPGRCPPFPRGRLLAAALACWAGVPTAGVWAQVVAAREAPAQVVAGREALTADLGGPWKFRAGDSAAWSRPDLDDAAWTTIVLPGEPSRPHGGVSWLRRLVRVDGDSPLAVGVGPAHDAYEVFANGVRIGQYGTVAPHPVPAAPAPRWYEVPPGTVQDGRIVLAIRLWTSPTSARLFTGSEPLVGGPLIVGPASAVRDRIDLIVARHVSSEIPILVVVAIAFFVGLYHLHLYRRRRELAEYLWYGCVCLGSAAFLWAFAFVTYRAGEGFLPGARLVNALSSLTWFAIIGFITRLFEYRLRPWQRAYQRAQLAFAAAFALPLSFDVMLLLSLVAVYQMLPGFFAIAWLTVRKAWQGHPEARTIGIGLGVSTAAVFYDNVVVWMFGAETMRLEPFGFAAVILAMALSLANRFVRLYGALDERNATLARFNASATRFVPDEFLGLLGRGSIVDIERGDHIQREMSVLFSDVRGFTTLVEAMGEAESFRFINEYLESMEVPILAAGGFINQYTGDAIMALFDGTADRAVRGAIGMAAAVGPFNERRTARGFPAIRIGIGIESGPLMLGTIGGSRRLDCGVISDTVNTAARIESLTQRYGCTLIVGEGTWRRIPDGQRPLARAVGRVRPKGKTEAVTLYDLLDAEPEERRAAKVATRPLFDEGWNAFVAGDFTAARRAFG
ncbi:MAG: adenylate/guanylate cyclase domain-containing protein, partial [Gemmatimonadota bacterium]|nr:adenylate/guanylate cyclase domain-containing protein [Gemmatimonadota bacterium]